VRAGGGYRRIEATTDDTLTRQLDALRALVAFARDEVSPLLDGGNDPYDRLVIVMLFARATTTAEAVAALGDQGFGQQAMMLNRSLYEYMIDAHWAHANHKLARERFVQHAQLLSRFATAPRCSECHEGVA
jgi:hypothetical protein